MDFIRKKHYAKPFGLFLVSKSKGIIPVPWIVLWASPLIFLPVNGIPL